MKIMWISDDFDLKSGSGIQSSMILRGLRTRGHEIVYIAGFSDKPRDGIYPTESKDGIKKYIVHTSSGSSIINVHQIRALIQKELPDVLVAFHDPRLISGVFHADLEIRSQCPLVYWHLWDNTPYPTFNEPYYNSCDSIVAASKFTHDLLSENHVENTVIPCSVSSATFNPLTDRERVKIKHDFLTTNNIDMVDPFIILWNQRNIPRKRVGSLIEAYFRFAQQRDNTILLLHTNPMDPYGSNIPALIQRFGNRCGQVAISPMMGQDEEYINNLINMSDFSINICSNEGFGLPTVESLFAGVPIIATLTGGLIDQLYDESRQLISGIALQPEVTNIASDQRSCLYVTENFVSVNQIVDALQVAYDMPKDQRNRLGMQGRDHVLSRFEYQRSLQLWEDHLLGLVSRWKPLSKFRVVSL